MCAQCSECQREEIKKARVNGKSNYDSLKMSFKLNLKLLFSRLFLANWLDLSASDSEAITPRRSTNRVLLLSLVTVFVVSSLYTWTYDLAVCCVLKI